MINVDTTECAFDAANSTLFLLLGGLARLQQMRRALPRSRPRRKRKVTSRPEEARRDATEPDPMTLALLGLLATGFRLEQLSGEATETRPSAPRAAGSVEPRPPARRKSTHRKTDHHDQRDGRTLPRVLLR